MRGRNITETELNKVQKMIDSGMADADIAYCMDFSEKTIERIRTGKHILQIRKMVAETINEATNVSVPERKIIELLNELVAHGVNEKGATNGNNS